MPGEEGGMGFERPASGGGTPGVDIQKVVFVDATGVQGVNCDYTTIAAAAAYLKSLVGKRGGIIALRGSQNHIVSTNVDARGIEFRSVGEGRPTIQAAAGGFLRAMGCIFRGIKIIVPAGVPQTFFIDFAGEAGNIDFQGCDFAPAAGKYIFGGTCPSLTLTFRLCGQSDQNGAMIDPAATLPIYFNVVIGENALGPLQFVAYDVYADDGGRYDTTGQIIGLPNGSLYAAPGENLQSRIDSLAAIGGGKLVVLPGIHYLQNKLIVGGNSIQMEGSGDASIIRANAAGAPTNPWLGTELVTDALIEIGAADGSAPVNDCHVHGIRVQVAPNIHGIKTNGGNNNDVSDNTVESTVLKTAARTAIVMTDSQANPAYGIKVTSNHVRAFNIGTGLEDPTLRWVDAVHIDGDAPFVGATFGYGNNCYDVICQGNIVKHCHETGYVMVNVFNGSIFVNRSRTVCFTATAIGLALLQCEDCEVVSGSIIDSQLSGTGVWLYECINLTIDDITVDGVSNNFTRSIDILSNSDRNTVKNNTIKNAALGIAVNAGCVDNEITPNNFDPSVVSLILDNGTTTKYNGRTMSGTGNPVGAVTGFFGDIFHDTAGNILYMCTSKPTGTTWKVI